MPTDADRIAELARLTSPNPPPDAPRPARAAPSGYLVATKTATYGFLAALPLLALYEVGILFANGGHVQQVRVGADVWLKALLAFLGGTGWMALGLVVLLVGAAVFWRERRRRPPIRARYFGLIVAESLLYAFLLAFAVGGAVQLLFGIWAAPTNAMAQVARLPLGLQLALSIGAGLYEELVFRVLLVGGLFLVARRLFRDRRWAYLAAAVVGAALFSLVHYVGAYGDPFTLPSFTFRFLFGLALNGVFLLRGFAVAAWTHALYDVLVVTRLLG